MGGAGCGGCGGWVWQVQWESSHWKRVDHDGKDENDEYANDGANDVPLVVLPNDHLESFPRGSNPQEGSRWAAGQEVEVGSKCRQVIKSVVARKDSNLTQEKHIIISCNRK